MIETTCPLRLAMDIIGGRWKLSIICLLENGKPMRYNQIKRKIPGITNMMLAQSLKNLEEHSIVKRTQYNEMPVRVEYQLSQSGFELLSALKMLSDWGNKYISAQDTLTSLCPTCQLVEHETSRET